MQSEAAARQNPQSANPLAIQDQQAGWRVTVTERGILSYETRRGAADAWQPIAFRSDASAGPQWFVQTADSHTTNVVMTLKDKERLLFEGRAGKLVCSLRYASIRDRLALVAAIRNDGPAALESLRAGLRLGLDTYMSHYPQWLDKMFPTLLRCEKTHFWGYAMSPHGRILGIASPDPVASYHFAYNITDDGGDGGHRIYTISLDLLNPLPLPSRHPQDLHGLAPGQSREWTIFLGELASLDDVKPALADWTGAYKNGNTHYTSVAYVAKSILETALVEKELSRKNPIWAERCQRHYESARRAIDDLERSRDNVRTEGEMTFEDGMISCTCLQLGMFALLQDDPAQRAKYRDAALDLARKHRCLSQILIPDCRMNGATLRFWESQYDVKMTPNMMNSPHGWSAWRIFGIWYLYLLTGQEEWLRQTMNALGTCVQLIDTDTGRLRWAFVPDPYIKARPFKQDPARPGKGLYAQAIIGEQYLDMISDWYQAPPNTWVTGYWGDNDGGCCDNDVHEIFKCLEEVALTSAYVVERPGGELAAWNCTVESKDGDLSVSPAENIVEKVHLNLQKPHRVTVRFGRGALSAECKGIQWMETKSER